MRDYFILIGHTWICPDCRLRLLTDPEAMLIGHKVSDEERACILTLTDESFGTMMALAAATVLSVDELREAIDHPRSRLRHLGVNKRRR
ncbi:MAG: hypothetical protein KJZ86_02160 [Caldilineaceae bacterium]|nr:hypothetical protein [Caldilineaceae bacterium]HRJ44889.1 hypothetical protein [Caldilineaceae bacterium]